MRHTGVADLEGLESFRLYSLPVSYISKATPGHFDAADPTAMLDLALILGPYRLNIQGKGVSAIAKKPNSEQPQPGPSFSITERFC